MVVSIPRSEFWSFGHELDRLYSWTISEFQFLGRNSGRSDGQHNRRLPLNLFVSIPRSEFWSFGRNRCHPFRRSWSGFNSSVGILVVRTRSLRRELYHQSSLVSIPRSEFWSFGRTGGWPGDIRFESFNSSVGILVVRTCEMLG